MKAKTIIGILLLGLCVASIIWAPTPKPPAFREDRLTIATAHGPLPFSIEVAETPAQQAYGLMYRTSMPHDHGMLFLWPSDREIHMWMKNTILPLDMLFIDSHGKIVHIVANATPYSETDITAGQPVEAVIELLGGTAATDGIKEGDKVVYPYFKP